MAGAHAAHAHPGQAPSAHTQPAARLARPAPAHRRSLHRGLWSPVPRDQGGPPGLRLVRGGLQWQALPSRPNELPVGAAPPHCQTDMPVRPTKCVLVPRPPRLVRMREGPDGPSPAAHPPDFPVTQWGCGSVSLRPVSTVPSHSGCCEQSPVRPTGTVTCQSCWHKPSHHSGSGSWLLPPRPQCAGDSTALLAGSLSCVCAAFHPQALVERLLRARPWAARAHGLLLRRPHRHRL